MPISSSIITRATIILEQLSSEQANPKRLLLHFIEINPARSYYIVIMQLIKILQVTILIASQAWATPVPESEALTPNVAIEVIKRANPAPVTCGRKLELTPPQHKQQTR